jgi:hypothetical protein
LRSGGNAFYVSPESPETQFASYFDFGRPGILMFFLTAVFLQPKNLEKVAGRTRKGRNVVLRFVAPRKGTSAAPF